jgi:hypothetical protein
MDDKTRSSLIKLAFNRKELRPVLLPLIEKGKMPDDGSFERTLHVDSMTHLAAGKYQIEGNVKLASDGQIVLEKPFQGTVDIDTSSVTYTPGTKTASDAFFEMVVSDLVATHHASIFALAMNS